MLNSRMLTNSDQLEICKIHASGVITVDRLAKKYGCSVHLIRRVLQAHGVKKGRKQLTEEQRQQKLQRRRERHNERYQNDPAYREKYRARARSEDPDKRRARQNRRYAENEDYRRYIAEYGKQRREKKNAELLPP